MYYQGKNYDTYADLQDARNGVTPSAAIVAPGGGKGPSQMPAPSMAPAPFTPEPQPPTLPMQPSMQGFFQQSQNMQGQMPATKGSGKGPSQMQTPMQAGPGNLNGANATMQPGSNRPMDLQALIQGLMSSGLLGGL